MFEVEDRLWWYVGMRAITSAILENSINSTSNPRLLDVGCGTGFSVHWLREQLGAQAAFGVDISPNAALFWRERDLDTLALAKGSALPFCEGEFDLVTCFDVVYQLDDDEAASTLSEIRRVLRPGGRLFIREPAYNWMKGAHDIAVGTRKRYTLGGLTRMLSTEGFTIKRRTYANTLLFGAAVPHRLLSRFRGAETSDVREVPPLMNRAMTSALRVEARLLRRISFPFGLSVAAVAEKKK